MIRDILGELDDTPSKGRDLAMETYSPALVRLGLDAESLIEGAEDVPGLQGGFDSRREIIEWEQRLAVRTLGEVPMFVYQGMASQLASPKDRPVIQALLDDPDLDGAEEWRKRVRSRVVLPAFDRAIRRLRIDATEYTDAADEGDQHDPIDQRYIAMRPSIEELDEWQHHALDAVLGDGLEDRDEILDWATTLEYATYGEPIQLRGDHDDIPIPRLIQRLHERDPYTEMMTERKHERARETLAARFLIPSFNAGVRERLGKSGEIAAADTKEKEDVAL